MPRSYRIQTEEDVSSWRSSPGYTAFVDWIARRSQRIVGKEILVGNSASERINKLMNVLEVMEQWIEEVPILPESQRFGNKAFRTYIDIVEKRLPNLLPTPPTITSHILPLLISSHAFGHPVRLDYGSGHELSFALALWVWVRMGWVGGKGGTRDDSDQENGKGKSKESEAEGIPVAMGDGEEGSWRGEMIGEEEEDELVLRVFPRYLTLVTNLQKKYRLEPAGSHGVWGLDDYCFLPYVWGSGQMLGFDITPTQALDNAKQAFVNGTETKDLWTLSLKRVFEFKSGPFFEHSPLLHSLSTTMPSFVKVHRGLLKMYQEEVLGKRVVVQHLFLDEITWGGEVISPHSAIAVQTETEETKANESDQKKNKGIDSKSTEESRIQAAASTPPPWTMPPTRSSMSSSSSNTATLRDGNATGLPGFEATRAPWAR